MKIIPTEIPGVLIIEPQVFGDARGWFLESWQLERYAAVGIPAGLVQDNQAYSRHGVLRGLHIQHPHAQGKLVQVLRGEVFDVAVDVRPGSPWFGRWTGVLLSGDNHRQFWVPPGFAHGYYVTGEDALFSYKCSDFYHPEHELSIAWNDPAIGIAWPLQGEPILSAKDLAAFVLAEVPTGRLPGYASFDPAS
jgi:dTDP-4-dehydrorhamnose 3,5-epimerase